MKTAVTILFLASILLTDTHAAEITAIPEGCSGPCAYLKGEIKSGDLIILKAVFESPTRRRVFIPDFKPPTEIFELQLNSRGGSLEEAMEIGRWVRKNKIHTRLQGTNSECFSSCVYVFAAGISRVSFAFLKQMVGIHRPGGHLKFLHPWPPQTPPPLAAGRRDFIRANRVWQSESVVV